MSKEVDSRVVELQFDNSNFEKNTKETMSTIDKLMEKLKFKGAEEGFGSLNEAAEDVDFDPIEKGINNLNEQFSLLNVMARRTFENIVDDAYRYGKKLVKSLSIDQVTTGWGKYAQKTSNVQTIMNATGKSIDEVNGYLSKLMWYSDETSFGFTDMTSALSTMVSSGGDIEKLIPMIEGMANATAYAGKGASEFSRVIYNLNQSYSQGYLSLMDWKSVQLAGADSKQLIQTIIDTGVELGTIAEGDVTKGTFTSSLSDKWVTTEVMEQAFSKFSELTEAAYELVNAGEYDTASEAMEALAGQYDDIAEKSFEAAQKAKTFTEAIDATKDAVSSKWSEMFELIFGNMEEASETWTELSNRLYDMFATPLDKINELLKDALNDGWSQFTDQGGIESSSAQYLKILEDIMVSSKAVTEEEIEAAGGFKKLLGSGVLGLNRMKTIIKQVSASVKKLDGMSDEELESLNVSRDKLDAYKDSWIALNDAVEDGSLDLKQLMTEINRPSGRDNLAQSLWNLWDALQNLFAPLNIAFEEVFGFPAAETIYQWTVKLKEFTASLSISEEASGNLTRIFKGLFNAVKTGITAVKSVFKSVSGLFDGVLSLIGKAGSGLLGVLANVADFVTALSDVIVGGADAEETLNGLSEAVGGLSVPVEAVYRTLTSVDWQSGFAIIQNGVDRIVEAAGGIGILEKLGSALLTLFQLMVSGGASALSLLGAITTSAAELAEKAFGTMSTAVAGHKVTLEEFKKSITELPDKAGKAVAEFATGTTEGFDKLTKALSSAFGPFENFFTMLTTKFLKLQDFDIYRLMSLIDVAALAYMIGQLSKTIKSLKSALSNPITDVLKSVSGVLDSTKKFIESQYKIPKWQQAAIVMKAIAVAILAIAGAMYIVSKIDEEQLWSSFSIITVLMIEIGALTAATAHFTKRMGGNKLGKIGLELAAIGVAMYLAAKGISSILSATNELPGTNAIEKAIAVMAIAMSMAVAVVAVAYGVKGFDPTSAKTIFTLGISVLAISSGFAILIKAIGTVFDLVVGKTSGEAMWDRVHVFQSIIAIVGIVIAGITAAIGAAAKSFQGVDFRAVLSMSTTLLSAGSAFALLGVGVGIMVLSFAALAATVSAIPQDKYSTVMDTFATMVLFIGGMTLLMTAIAYIKVGSLMKSAAALAIVCGAFGLLTASFAGIAAIASMPLIKYDTAMKLFTTLMGTLAGALAALAIISGMTDGLDLIATASALVVVAAAVDILAIGIIALASLKWEKLKQGIIAVAAGLAALTGAALLISLMKKPIELAAQSLGTLALALLALSAASYIMGKADWTSLLKLGAALAVILTAVIGFTAALYFFPQLGLVIGVLIKALEPAVTLFDKFAGACKKLMIAFAILGVISLFASPICEAIVGALPDITATLIAVINSLCEIIIACADPLTKALAVLVAKLWENCIAPLLKSLWNAIKTTVKNFFSKEKTPVDLDIPITMTGTIDIENQSSRDFFKARDEALEETADWYNDGKNVVDGTELGVTENINKLNQVGADAANELEGGFTGALRIESPSKVMAENGLYVVEGLANGVKTNQQKFIDAMIELAKAGDNAFRDYYGIHSPSEQGEEEGENIGMGLSQGMFNSREEFIDAAIAMGKDGDQAFCDYWGITEGELALGYQRGNAVGQDVADGLEGSVDAVSRAAEKVGDAAGTTLQGTLAKYFSNKRITNLTTGRWAIDFDQDAIRQNIGASNVLLTDSGITEASNDLMTNLQNGAGSAIEFLGQVYSAVLGNLGIDPNEDIDPDEKLKTSGSGSSTKKTAAEKIKEQHEAALELLKTKAEVLDAEYDLWKTENEDTASAEELTAKMDEHAQAAINAQKDYVAELEAQYNELVGNSEVTEQEKLDAKSDLLSAKETLAKLIAEQYEGKYEQAIADIESKQDLADAEYELWTAQNEKTATDIDKNNREIAYINDELTNQTEIRDKALETYNELSEQLGADSRTTQEAYIEYLKQEQKAQELQNELLEQQLENFDLAIEEIEKMEELYNTRHSMMSKIYDDGDLSNRKSAYESAYSEHGTGIETIRANNTGTLSAIMAVDSSLKSMWYSAKKLDEQRGKLAEATAKGNFEAAETAEKAILSEKSALVDLFGELADGFGLEDSAKSAMMQFGYAIADNYDYIKDGMSDVWKAVNESEIFKDTAQQFSALLGPLLEDETQLSNISQTAYAGANLLVSLQNQEWGEAAASMLNFALSIGKVVKQAGGLQQLVTWFKSAGSAVKSFAGILQNGQVAEGVSGVVKTLGTLAGGEAGGGILASITSGLSGIGSSALAAFESLGPIAWAITAIVAAFAALTAIFWDKDKSVLENLGEGLKQLFYISNPIGWIMALFDENSLFNKVKEKLKTFFGNLGRSMKEFFSSGIGNVIKQIFYLINPIGMLLSLFDENSLLRKFYDWAINLGKNIVSGIANGIKGFFSGIWDAIKSVGQGIINGFKSLFGIHSPSTVMAEMGGYIGAGFSEGISASANGVTETVDTLSNSAISVAEEAMAQANDILNNPDNLDPTISPVVDLTSAEEGASWLNSLFGTTATSKLNVSRSAEMATSVGNGRKNQNGVSEAVASGTETSNADVITAINALGDRMDGVGNSIRGMQVTINSKQLVGSIANDMDNELGRRSRRMS